MKKDEVIELYKEHRSKRKVAQLLNVTRQYVIQVVRDWEKENAAFTQDNVK